MLCVSPQVFICPTSSLIAHKNSYGSTTGRAKVRAKFFGLYLAQIMPIRNHQFQTVLSVKSESGHCLKFFCLLQSLKFPQENTVCWARSNVIKIFLAFFGSLFSIPPYLTVNHHQLSEVRLLYNKFPWFETSHCIAYLYHAQDTWLCVCLIILVTCSSQKMNFSPCFSKAKMPFLIFLCHTVFSLYGLLSKSESLWMAEAFPLACPWKTAPWDSAVAFNTNIKTASPYDFVWAL